MQLDALEQLTPFEVRQAGKVLANLQNAWRSATPDEQREICNIILDKVVYDFALGKIARISPKPEYEVLFKMVNNPELRADMKTEISEL